MRHITPHPPYAPPSPTKLYNELPLLPDLTLHIPIPTTPPPPPPTHTESTQPTIHERLKRQTAHMTQHTTPHKSAYMETNKITAKSLRRQVRKVMPRIIEMGARTAWCGVEREITTVNAVLFPEDIASLVEAGMSRHDALLALGVTEEEFRQQAVLNERWDQEHHLSSRRPSIMDVLGSEPMTEERQAEHDRLAVMRDLQKALDQYTQESSSEDTSDADNTDVGKDESEAPLRNFDPLVAVFMSSRMFQEFLKSDQSTSLLNRMHNSPHEWTEFFTIPNFGPCLLELCRLSLITDF